MESQDGFDAYVDGFFDALHRWDPAVATVAGLHQYDSEMGPRSADAHRSRLDEISRQAGSAERLARSRLTPSQRTDLELIRGRLASETLSLRTLETWKRDPASYLWGACSSLDSLMRRAFAPPKERLGRLLDRLRAYPRTLDDMMANVGSAPAEFRDLGLSLARGSAVFLNSGMEPWARAAADGDPALGAEIRSAHHEAADTLERAIAWLGDLPAEPEGRFAIGADALAARLEHGEMIGTPLPTLLEIARTNLERDHRDFIEVAGRIDAGSSPAEIVESLSDDRPGAAGLLDWARSTLDRVLAFLRDRPLVALPSTRDLRITETPPHYRFGAFAAMDSPGAYERVARDAFYYVTPPEAGWSPEHREAHLRLFNRPVMEIITIHEACPGHFLQFANSHRFPTHTRRLLSSDTNVEGWAHYVEQMMIEEGYGASDPRIRLAQLLEALVRDCRFVAAIGLHTGTMSVSEAVRLFTEQAFMEPDNAMAEARRGTFDPTYLSYTVGKLGIYKLRDDWEAKHGRRDLVRFHDALLGEGGVPIRILRRRLLGNDAGAAPDGPRGVDEDSVLYPPEFYRRGTSARAAG